jgi:hypothetical protein
MFEGKKVKIKKKGNAHKNPGPKAKPTSAYRGQGNK